MTKTSFISGLLALVLAEIIVAFCVYTFFLGARVARLEQANQSMAQAVNALLQKVMPAQTK